VGKTRSAGITNDLSRFGESHPWFFVVKAYGLSDAHEVVQRDVFAKDQYDRGIHLIEFNHEPIFEL
jgi:hypothetical protein